MQEVWATLGALCSGQCLAAMKPPGQKRAVRQYSHLILYAGMGLPVHINPAGLLTSPTSAPIEKPGSQDVGISTQT